MHWQFSDGVSTRGAHQIYRSSRADITYRFLGPQQSLRTRLLQTVSPSLLHVLSAARGTENQPHIKRNHKSWRDFRLLNANNSEETAKCVSIRLRHFDSAKKKEYHARIHMPKQFGQNQCVEISNFASQVWFLFPYFALPAPQPLLHRRRQKNWKFLVWFLFSPVPEIVL